MKTPAVPFKLYRVYADDDEPSMEFVTVHRVTPQRWWFKGSGLAFGCRSFCEPFPDYCFNTPEAAWRAAVESAKEELTAARLRHKKIMRAAAKKGVWK